MVISMLMKMFFTRLCLDLLALHVFSFASCVGWRLMFDSIGNV
jgi:hypothetical protein